ncbi:hypothetical protein EUX98_g9181 [Antrodiella citrinella]|uniref:GATA-type domain-containing protein n=1 Tax=Antrodiella citrinella TaxID=2447956 RepID=A0A4S4LX20_9APHY|nr:hypothetical protein EUX98_g9181 [Antrodiella citrinella]
MRSSGPSATPVNGVSTNGNTHNNSAPGGVKAECSNCGVTHMPLWRRGLNDELNCNACSLYCKLRVHNNHGAGRSQTVPRQESQEVVAQCSNCHTTTTPLWRNDDEGKTVCNAASLRTSPTADIPTLTPDSTTQMNYGDNYSNRKFMNVLGSSHQHRDGAHNGHFGGQFYSAYSVYHPDYLSQLSVA